EGPIVSPASAPVDAAPDGPPPEPPGNAFAARARLFCTLSACCSLLIVPLSAAFCDIWFNAPAVRAELATLAISTLLSESLPRSAPSSAVGGARNGPRAFNAPIPAASPVGSGAAEGLTI